MVSSAIVQTHPWWCTEIFMFCQTFQVLSQLQINCTGAQVFLQLSTVYFSNWAECISPIEQGVFLQLSRMYFSNWAECISPPQRSVAKTSQQQIWSVSKSLTDPIKVDRDATNYDRAITKSRSEPRRTKSHAFSYERLSWWILMGLLCPFQLRFFDLTSHPLVAMAMTLQTRYFHFS